MHKRYRSPEQGYSRESEKRDTATAVDESLAQEQLESLFEQPAQQDSLSSMMADGPQSDAGALSSALASVDVGDLVGDMGDQPQSVDLADQIDELLSDVEPSVPPEGSVSEFEAVAAEPMQVEELEASVSEPVEAVAGAEPVQVEELQELEQINEPTGPQSAMVSEAVVEEATVEAVVEEAAVVEGAVVEDPTKVSGRRPKTRPSTPARRSTRRSRQLPVKKSLLGKILSALGLSR